MLLFKKIKNIYILIISIVVIFSSNKNKTILEYCDIDKYCESCTFCGNETNDYTPCSYYNLFCIKNSSDIFFQDSYLNKYTTFFRNISNANDFCGKQTYIFDLPINSFSIINKTAKNIQNSNINHCNYEIYNTQYFYNFEGTANLIIRLKTNNVKKNKIKLIFNILLRDTRSLSSKQKIIKEIDLIKEDYKLILFNYNIIIILVDFYVDGEIKANIDEYIEVRIDIDNNNVVINSFKTIIFRVIFTVFILLIIYIIIIVYYRHKKNIDITRIQNEFIQNKKLKEKQKTEKIDKLFKTILTAKEFNKNDVTNGCTECMICIEKFINKCIICITPCKHIFHNECLCKFIETAKKNENPIIKCPLCNYDFLEEKNDNKKLNYINSTNIEINDDSISKNELNKN